MPTKRIPKFAVVLPLAALAIGMVLMPSIASAQAKRTKVRADADAWQVDAAKLPKRAPVATSCAQYGAGFVKLAGSETCVRMGGSVEAGVGVNSGGGR